ncbi:LCP family protein [Actinoplanes sp. NPDC051851]|uniref:LCP family protein n=1 Tax=Actinoplanes sp. NPDC051851 TaxID=3154753 RepID=UPI0034125870
MSTHPDLAEPEQSSSPEESSEAPAPGKRRRRWRIVLYVLLVFVLLGAGGAVAGGLYLKSVEKSVERVDAFSEVPEAARPTKAAVATDALNILMLGSDSRDPDNTQGSRADTIIIAHLTKDRSSAQLISIPRDTWVYVPKAAKNDYADRNAKINASYAWGGIPLVVQTVEKFTGVRIDNVAIVDFGGFKEIIDALGGIDIEVEQDFTSIHPPYRKFTKGTMHMDGATALDYSRQRKQFADGDFARIRHQQQVITAILDKGASGGLLGSPTKLNDFLRATANSVSVDKTMSLVDLASQLRHLRSGNLTFLTNPSKGTGMVGSESVVFPDKAKDKTLYEAVQNDKVDEILAAATK